MPSADSLTWDLARHEALEVVAGCSALMLLPENCTSADGLLALSRTALELVSTGERSVEHVRWGRWLLDSPSLHAGSRSIPQRACSPARSPSLAGRTPFSLVANQSLPSRPRRRPAAGAVPQGHR